VCQRTKEHRKKKARALKKLSNQDLGRSDQVEEQSRVRNILATCVACADAHEEVHRAACPQASNPASRV